MYSQSDFNKFILDHEVLKIFAQPIRLRSGQFSHIYLNWRNVTNDPFLIDQATDFLLKFAKDLGLAPDCYLGVPEGATKTGIISTYKLAKSSNAFSQNSHFLPMGRGAPKDHGEVSDRFFIGFPDNKEVIVIEDVTTTGGSLMAFIDTLISSGVNVTSAIAMTNRMQNPEALSQIFEKRYEGKCVYHAMTTIQSLADTIAQENLLPDAELKTLLSELNPTSSIAA